MGIWKKKKKTVQAIYPILSRKEWVECVTRHIYKAFWTTQWT